MKRLILVGLAMLAFAGCASQREFRSNARIVVEQLPQNWETGQGPTVRFEYTIRQ